MPAHKNRSATQREAQLAAIAAGYLRGVALASMAEQLACSRQQIVYDLAILRKRWRLQAQGDFNQKLALELARIDQVEQEYWAAWERSKQPRERTLSEQRQGQTATTRAQVQRQQRDGSAFFLEGVERCIDRRIRLFGLDRAGVEAEADKVTTFAELVERARRRRAAAEASGAGAGAG